MKLQKLAIGVGIAALFILILFSIHQQLRPTPGYFAAVPTDAALLAEISDPKQLHAFEKELKAFGYPQLRKDCSDWVAMKDSSFTAWIADAPHLLIPYKRSRHAIGISLIYQSLPKGFDLSFWMDGLMPDQRSQWHGANIYQIKLADSASFVISQYENLLLLSNDAAPIEEMISAINEPSSKARLLYTLAQQTPAAPLRLLMHYRDLLKWCEPYLKNSSWHSSTRSLLPPAWLFVALNKDADRIHLSGFMEKVDGSPFSKAGDIRQPSNAVETILPANFLQFTKLKIRNYGNTFTNSKANFLQQAAASHWLGPQMVWVVLDPIYGNTLADRALVLELTNHQKVKDELLKYGGRQGILDSLSYQTYMIRQFNDPHFFESLEFGMLANPYFTIIDSFLVFCSSKSTLTNWVDFYLTGQTLGNSADYMAIRQAEQESGFGYSFTQLASIRPILAAMLTDTLAAHFTRFEWTTAYDALSINFRQPKRHIMLEGGLHQFSTTKSTGQLVWKVQLDAPAATAPIVLENEDQLSTKLVIQDAKQQLYLLDMNGSILSRQHLDGRLLSNVFQPQLADWTEGAYLLNTTNAIYLMDQNGQPKPGFPIQLATKATAGLSLVDYGGRGEYVFYVPLTNGLVNGFDIYGNAIAGWNPQRQAGVVKFSLQHIEKDGRDYLISLANDGLLSIFQRDGKLRFAVPIVADTLVSLPAVELNKQRSRIAVGNGADRLTIINLDGQHFRLQVPVGANQNTQFKATNLSGDVREEYIVLSNDHLATYSYTGDTFGKRWEQSFDQPMDSFFLFQAFENQYNKIGLLDRKNEEIWLLDEQGQAYPGFPMTGTTAFQLVPLVEQNAVLLIAAKEELVYAYRLEL